MALIEINRRPSHAELQRFAAIWLPLFAAIVGSVVLYRTGVLWIAACIWIPAVAIAAMGLVSPRRVRPVYVACAVVTYPLGWMISHLLLAIVFFGVVTPVGLVMRLAGRDPLERPLDRDRPSYWTPLESSDDPARYFRQY